MGLVTAGRGAKVFAPNGVGALAGIATDGPGWSWRYRFPQLATRDALASVLIVAVFLSLNLPGAFSFGSSICVGSPNCSRQHPKWILA
jgi:hypothetical protein